MHLLHFAKELINKINKDLVLNGAAAVAYYLTFAIFPFLILLLSSVAYLPISNLDKTIFEAIGQILPPQGLNLLTGVIHDVTSNKRGGLLSFGALATLWSASSGTFALMQQLNITYNVTEKRSFLKTRANAIGLTLFVGLLMIVAFSLIVVGGEIQGWIESSFNLGQIVSPLFLALRWLIVIAAFLLALSFLYHFGPDIEHEYKFITPGSLLGVAILIIASHLFRIYVSRFGNFSATYGSIGAVIMLMLWLYIAGLVILCGAEINTLLEYSRRDQEKAFPKSVA